MADTRFQPGNPGRPPGSKNRFTALRDDMLEAFERLGGVDGLVAWAEGDPDRRGAFYQMVARMLPRPVELSADDRKVEVVIRSFRDIGDAPTDEGH